MRLISRLDQSRWLPPGRRIQELPRGNELPITMDAADLQSSRTINPRGPQMITKQTKTTFRRFPRRDQGIGDHDPAQLSASLRELAIRAFRLVRARDRTASEYAGGAECSEKALDEVHGQIVQLQRALRAEHGRPGCVRHGPASACRGMPRLTKVRRHLESCSIDSFLT